MKRFNALVAALSVGTAMLFVEPVTGLGSEKPPSEVAVAVPATALQFEPVAASWCGLSCEYLGEFPDPQYPNHPYVYEFGGDQCEDDYSTLFGPCLPCDDEEPLGCDEPGYYRVDIETFCEEYNCEATEQLEAAVRLLLESDVFGLGLLVDRNPSVLMLHGVENRLDVLSCSGVVAASLEVPAATAARLRSRQQDR